MTEATTTAHYEPADCIPLEAPDRLSSGLGSFMLLGVHFLTLQHETVLTAPVANLETKRKAVWRNKDGGTFFSPPQCV